MDALDEVGNTALLLVASFAHAGELANCVEVSRCLMTVGLPRKPE